MAKVADSKSIELNMEGMDKGQQEALRLAMGVIEKDYGVAFSVYGKKTVMPDVEWFSSGAPSLDDALGVGYAKGRIIEIYGPESSGKTTLTLLAIVNAQKSDPRPCAFLDMEHALDVTYAKKLGVDMERLIISQPDNAEQCLNAVKVLVESGAVSTIVVDSVAALVPQKELEGEVGDAVMGLQARLMSQTLRIITGAANKHKITVFFINQIRMKIGVMFGNPETTTGGNSLKFYASQRLDCRRTEKLKADKDSEDHTGIKVKVKVVKNKVAPPFAEAEITIGFGTGIDYCTDLVSFAEKKGVLLRSGAWYSWKGQNIGQGAPNTADFLRENETVRNEVVAALQAA